MAALPQVIAHEPIKEKMIGGGLEGAQSTSRETVRWQPSFRSPDQIINEVKPTADARTQDMVQNDGYAAGVSSLHRDSIVGNQYRLNAQPNWRVLGVSEEWAEEFQQIVESRFNMVAESPECWLDASRRNTFTGLVRMCVGSCVITGEALATAEWIKDDPRRPFKTAIQLISPARLSNPDGTQDDRNLRRGVHIDHRGRPLGYWIRSAYPTESYDSEANKWKYVPAEKPWGREQVLHIMEQILPAQNRGVAEMVAVLKQMRMTKTFQDVVLQNAVVNATYAAAIESELPSAQVFEMLGAANGGNPINGMQNYLGAYLDSLGQYLNGSKNIAIDGAKIPHLFPGTKLNMQMAGTPGGVGTSYEESLHRHIAAAVGVSYEEFSRDYSKVNYSSARASANNTWKSMQAKKKVSADRFASAVYALWLEEEIAAGNIPLPRRKTRDWFYEPLVKDALLACSWIGASRGQVDELKETQSAVMRINANMSTLEKETARLGEDYREILAQRARETKLMESLGLNPVISPVAPGAAQGNAVLQQQDETTGKKSDKQDAEETEEEL